MRSKSKVLFEVFVPQNFSVITFRRTPLAHHMIITPRKHGRDEQHTFPRPASIRGVAEDFRTVMEMKGSKPLCS